MTAVPDPRFRDQLAERLHRLAHCQVKTLRPPWRWEDLHEKFRDAYREQVDRFLMPTIAAELARVQAAARQRAAEELEAAAMHQPTPLHYPAHLLRRASSLRTAAAALSPETGDPAARNAPAWVQAVTPTEIARQRALGWPDMHPEDYCHRCGRPNPTWFADTAEWQTATGSTGDGGGIPCPSCFCALWEQVTGRTAIIWRLSIDPRSRDAAPADPAADGEQSIDLTPGVVWTDAQLAVVRALLVRATRAEAERDEAREEWHRQRERADDLRFKLSRVSELHRGAFGTGNPGWDNRCVADSDEWPCATRRALDGEADR